MPSVACVDTGVYAGVGYKKTGSLASEFQFNETACTSYIRPGCMASSFIPANARADNPLNYGVR